MDGNLQRKIVAALGAGPDDEVLEIGPGRGALTSHLVGLPRRLVLVELDDHLAEDLRVRWGERPDVHLVHGDVLDVDVASLAERPRELLVVGNIPYNITTPILFHLLARPRPARILLMVQKEVAERIVAEPGTSEYGALAVGVRTVARVEKVLDVPRTCFRPVPRVDSSVIRVVPLDPPVLSASEEERLRNLTRMAFQWRRKQMRKILRDHPDSPLDRDEVDAFGETAGYDLSRRPETFSPDDFVRLSRLLAEAG